MLKVLPSFYYRRYLHFDLCVNQTRTATSDLESKPKTFDIEENIISDNPQQVKALQAQIDRGIGCYLSPFP